MHFSQVVLRSFTQQVLLKFLECAVHSTNLCRRQRGEPGVQVAGAYNAGGEKPSKSLQVLQALREELRMGRRASTRTADPEVEARVQMLGRVANEQGTHWQVVRWEQSWST